MDAIQIITNNGNTLYIVDGKTYQTYGLAHRAATGGMKR